MEQLKACIFNIQKYSIHDGPGIRTVVFFKGCPLRCKWCSNPESQSSTIENSSLTTKVKYYTISEILEEVMKDEVFYEESNGGVTLSGGEVLLQHEFAYTFLKQLKEKGIHTAIETTGYTSGEIFTKVIENADLLLYDMKHYDKQKHFEATNVYNDIIIKNLNAAISSGKEVIVRIPVIPGVNSSLEDAQGFCYLLKAAGAKRINLLPFHQFGEKKYSILNRQYSFINIKPLHEEDLADYQKIFIQNGFDCYF